MKRKVGGIISAAFALVLGATAASGDETTARGTLLLDYRRPAEIPYPDANPFSAAKAELGRRLFFDPAFSKSRTLSCATCHDPALSWGDGRARALGEDPAGMSFRSPTLLNVAWTEPLGWDGKFHDLESVAFTPITGKSAMDNTEAVLLARLGAQSDYVAAFAGAFPDGALSRRNIELALATYERSIVSGEAPFDRWVAGDEQAIDDSAKRGFDLFTGRARCAGCHSGWAFTDGSFHDIGVATGADVGRGRLFPTSVRLRYAFKTPTLRDVARRAPYMHDGSAPTLEAVIDLYDRGGIDRPSRSELVRPLNLTAGEKADLIAFLSTLTGAPAPPAPGREFGAVP